MERESQYRRWVGRQGWSEWRWSPKKEEKKNPQREVKFSKLKLEKKC